ASRALPAAGPHPARGVGGAPPAGPHLEVGGPALQLREGTDRGGHRSAARTRLPSIDGEMEEGHGDGHGEPDQLVPATAHPPEAQRHGGEAYRRAGGGGEAPPVGGAPVAGKDRRATGITHKEAGVGIGAGDALVERIKPLAARTQRPEVVSGVGGFGGLFALPPGKYREPVLVSGTDGVGTKSKIAQAAGRHDTIGIDLVAMSANDVLTS